MINTKTTHSVKLSHAMLRWTHMDNRVEKKSAYPLEASSTVERDFCMRDQSSKLKEFTGSWKSGDNNKA
jgi:hypothetical protein